MLLLQPWESRKSVYRRRRTAPQSRLHSTVLDHLATSHPHRRPGLHAVAGSSAGRRRVVVVRRWASSGGRGAYRGRSQPAADARRGRPARQRPVVAAARERRDGPGRRWKPQRRGRSAAAADAFSHDSGGGGRRRRLESRHVHVGVRPADDVAPSRRRVRRQPGPRRPLSVLHHPVIQTRRLLI